MVAGPAAPANRFCCCIPIFGAPQRVTDLIADWADAHVTPVRQAQAGG
ncbi:hypothetical protein [Mycolicibacterium sarraceniae]|nr:hypothetical protein [Mycolicibacterium sarraceniae]